jgi:hypothetical protein
LIGLERIPPDLGHCDAVILRSDEADGDERSNTTIEPPNDVGAQHPTPRRVVRSRLPAALRFSTDASASLFQARLVS